MGNSNSIDGRFFLESRIGQGGMGEVWRGTQQPLGRPVAVKLLRRELSAESDIRRRFAREARAASALNHHNIISLYDFGVDANSRLYIAMELADGPSLADLIDTGVVLSAAQILDLADQILSGLAHAHARGVVHRDLKPDNVVFAQQSLPATLGIAKIVDFGIASVAGQDTDEEPNEGPRTALGTPRYMSPEQALGGRNLSPRTDLYNVGLILWEVVAGRPVFGALDGLEVMEHHVYEATDDLRDLARVELPELFYDALDKALSKRAHDRWASAGEMRDALLPAMEEAREERHVAPRLETSRAADSTSDLPVIPRLPFVGREQERELFESAFARALQNRRGSLILVEGSPGVGKSRLVNWARETVEEAGDMRANVGSFTQGDRSNLRGVQEVFETIFRTRGFHRSDVFARVGSRLAEWGHRSPEDRDAIVDFLRPTSEAETRPHEVSRLFATLLRVLTVAAETQPRLIVLEDLHWAGPEAFDFLDHLAVEFRHRDIPVVVVGTYRGQEIQARETLSNRLAALSRYLGETVERVELGRLDRHAGRVLLEAILPVTDEVADVVMERSNGIPLHAITLLRYLQAEDLLQLKDRRWTARDMANVREAVPPNLGSLFERRLAQVELRHGGLPLRDIAVAGAVAGLRFDFRVVEQMVASEVGVDQFDEGFDVLLQEEFVIADERGGDAYAFSHALLRDWLLGEGRRDGWAALHRKAAVAKENLVGNRVAEHGVDIAWHWREAGEWHKSVDWYARTAAVAGPNFAPRQAAKSLKAAVRLIDEQLDLDTDTVHPFRAGVADERFVAIGFSKVRLLQMLIDLGNLYEGFGDFAAAERTFRRVVVQVGPPEADLAPEIRASVAHAWLGIGHVSRQRGDLEGAWWAFERVLELSADLPDEPQVFERGTRGLARLSWLRSEYAEAERWGQMARESAASRGDLDGEAVALWMLGDVARVMGDHDVAAERYEGSLSRHQETSNQVGIARNLLSMGQLARHRHRWDAAKDLYSRALRLWRSLGNRRGAGQALNGLGEIARFQKRYADAAEAYVEATEIFASIGANYDLAVATANLGINALGLGQFEEAQAALESARKLIEDQNYPYLSAGIDFHRALLLEHQQHGDEPADAPVPELDYALPLEQMAELRAAKGEVEEASKLLRRAREIYRRLELDAEVERLDAALSR